MALFEKLGNKIILIVSDILGALMVAVGANNDIIMAICGVVLVASATLYCALDDHLGKESE